MNKEVVHIKLGYNEALEGKRDLLSSELSILQLLKTIKRYHILRNQELSKKLEIQKRIKDIRTNMESLTRFMPKPKMPKSMQKRDDTVYEDKTKISYEKDLSPLEEELKEIQRKLKELE